MSKRAATFSRHPAEGFGKPLYGGSVVKVGVLQMSMFVPATIRGNSEEQHRALAKAALRQAMHSAIQVPECEKLVASYKCNGMITGHKVSDNVECVQKIIEIVPSYLRSALLTPEFTAFEKSQVLDGVLRRYWQLDNKGKIARTEAGEMLPAARLLKHEPAPTEG